MSQTSEAIENLKSAFALDPNIKNALTRDYPEAKSSKLLNLLDDKK
jgi:hypothetical protein